MTREEAIKFGKRVLSLSLFDETHEFCEIAIKALEQEPCEDTVSKYLYEQIRWERDVAVEQLADLGYELGEKIRECEDAISRQTEIVRCKDCRKHNVSVGYKKDCCPLYEFRGISYGHEHDYQFCCFAERRTDE